MDKVKAFFKSKDGWIAAVVIGIAAYVWAYPLLWSISLSLRTNEELMSGVGGLLVESPTLINYWNVFATSLTPRWFFNSFVVATSVTILHVSFATLAGYAFARLEFFGKKFLFAFVIAGIMIPEQAIFIPMHTMFSELEMHNTHLALILPRLSGAFGVLLMAQFFKAVPKSLDEAAEIDNAGPLRLFFQVILPLATPAVTTLAVFTFLGAWNDYLWPLVSITDPEMYTITVGLQTQMGQFGGTDQLGLLMANAVTASLPMIILFVIFQKHIVNGVSMNVGK